MCLNDEQPSHNNTGYKTTQQNVIADRMSRFKKETNSLIDFHQLLQEFSQLKCFQRFQASVKLVSAIMQTLLHRKCIDPTVLSQLMLRDPGRIII